MTSVTCCALLFALGFLALLPPKLRLASAAIAEPVHYIVTAEDPAGSFQLTIQHGRVTDAVIGGLSLPHHQLRHVRDSVVILRADGSRDFALQIHPTGGISWAARPPSIAH